MAKLENVVPILGEGWAKLLWQEFNKPYLRYVMQEVSKARKTGKVYPDSDKVFRAYKETPYEDCKVCIIGQDPYPTPGHANGLAFSFEPQQSNDVLPKSLQNIFRELEQDLGIDGHRNIAHNPDLGRWAKQGVMLLNTSLTVLARQSGSHSDIGWRKFTARTLEELAKKDNMIFVAWGKHAQLTMEATGDVMRNYFIRASHPSPYSAHLGFFGSKPFSKVNQILKEHGMEVIKW